MNHPHPSTGGGQRRIAAAPPRLREIEVLIISAQGLKNVKHVTKMRPYGEVYVEKDVHVARTHVDEKGGTNPTWNDTVKVKFREGLPESDVLAALNVDIYAHGHVREKPVGSARVLLNDVLKGGDAAEPADNPVQLMTVQVWRPSGRPHGLLNLWVPPTGRFLLRRESLSFSLKELAEEEEVAAAAVAGWRKGGVESEEEMSLESVRAC
ncbi:C2 domain containing protein [Parasponia andersonii]|uniref:C2 domain containing protein n=1 Tax=Parasponia andersonii TaxID=3476 RepID=A0A2P5A7Y9_PARAD|nr:C2 domain containing protein [Parasponia andersonii]